MNLETLLRAHLRRTAQKRGLRQVDLAKRLKKTQAQVSYIMTGKTRWTVQLLSDVSSLFGQEPERFLRDARKAS